MKTIVANRNVLTRAYNLGTGKTICQGAEIKEADKPTIEEHEVLVKVHVVALNQIDYKYIDLLSPNNSRIGCDYAGTVEQVGATAKGNWKIGDRIAGMVHGGIHSDQGAFAEYLRIDGDLAWHVPENAKDEDASTYGISATTAMLALNVHLGVPWVDARVPQTGEANDTILIYSGSTAVGLFAIQVAKAAGYKVVSTASPKSQELVKRYGADLVFDYRSPSAMEDIRKQFPNISKALDCISEGPSSNFCAEVMRGNKGKVVQLLENGKSKVPDITYDNIVIFTGFGLAWQWLPPIGPKFSVIPEDREALARFYEILPSVIDSLKAPPVEFVEKDGFDGILEGLNAVRAGKVSGKKLVVRIG